MEFNKKGFKIKMEKDTFDEFVEQLQRNIEKKEEKTYSREVIKQYRNPKNFRSIENPNTIGEIKGPCGDTMRIMLKIKDEIITDASFWTNGCGASIACGNKLTSMIIDKKINFAEKITEIELEKKLQGLPEEHKHCALLATNTLKKAVEIYYKKVEDEKK